VLYNQAAKIFDSLEETESDVYMFDTPSTFMNFKEE